MAKLTLEDLRRMRETGKKQIDTRQTHGKEIFIVIGMGTCGIAAGAKNVLNAFITKLDEKGISDAVVKQTGCMKIGIRFKPFQIDLLRRYAQIT